MKRARRFDGGFRFRRYAGQPSPRVEVLPRPGRVVVPLLQGFGSAVRPLVQPGEAVRAGQVIGRDDEAISTPVHASVTGRVVELVQVQREGTLVPAVAIEAGTDDGSVSLPGADRNWQLVPPERLEELLYLGGVTGLGAEGIPSRFRSSVIGPDEVEDVLVAGCRADAFNPSAQALLEGRQEEFAAGIGILCRVLPRARVHVVLDRAEQALLVRLAGLLAGENRVRVVAADSKYPQDSVELLTMTVLGRPFPFGYAAASAGIVALDLQAPLHAFDAATAGKPVIERTVALSGPGFRAPVHVRVRVGTAVESVVAGRLDDSATRVLFNSPLRGTDAGDRTQPVDRTVDQIVALHDETRRQPLAFARLGLGRDSWSAAFAAQWLGLARHADTNLHGEERPCVQCGYCAQACPVRIIPSLIHRSLRNGVGEAQMRYGVQQCIDCGLCTFVCPSKLPLAREMKETKQKLVDTGCDNWSCVLPKQDLRGLDEYKGVKSTR